jgi:hypothetical protein
MIDHLDGMAIFLGTHNEESTYNLNIWSQRSRY